MLGDQSVAMPKVARGRLSGLHGMSGHTSTELFAWANEIEAQIRDPLNKDDPKWLQRRADKVRRLAIQKEKSRSHKHGE